MQLFVQHLRSLCILVYLIGTGIASLKDYQGNGKKLHTIMAMVLVLTFLVSSVHGLFFQKKMYEGEPFVKVVRILWDLSWILLTLNAGLQLDGFINWTWNSVFYPMWISFAILITASLISVGTMLSAVIPLFCCQKKFVSRFMVSLWINMHLVAGCVFLIIIGTNTVDVLNDPSSDDKVKKLITTMIAFTIYVLCLLVCSVVAIKPLM